MSLPRTRVSRGIKKAGTVDAAGPREGERRQRGLLYHFSRTPYERRRLARIDQKA
jgi:hypothetical protein